MRKGFLNFKILFTKIKPEILVAVLALFLAALSSYYSLRHDWIVAYGDAESHLDIAKRVVDSLTPGFAQLGGIWLPLPHLLLVPFVKINYLWRTGLAGSIVSGACFVLAAVFLYKLAALLTKSRAAGYFAALVFVTNPNLLYLQSTPLTEMTLIVFFIISTYFFAKFLQRKQDLVSLLAAAGFGFLAALSRYDGWLLVGLELVAVMVASLPLGKIITQLRVPDFKPNIRQWWQRQKLAWSAGLKLSEGRAVLFGTLSFFGIVLWLLWGWLILGDPLYFTHSQFSAKSQQLGWQAKGELPAYHSLRQSFIYYFFTSKSNIGTILFIISLAGLLAYFLFRHIRHRWLLLMVLLTPFIFYVVTLYMGQSIIFLPGVTPKTFEWTLFNARYGAMMVPVAALFLGFLFALRRWWIRAGLVLALLAQLTLFALGFAPVITLADGTVGLSASKRPDAERWMAQNYTSGLVLLDDYNRTISVIRSNIPMQDVIYVGTKPYWDEALNEPQKYTTWVVMQKNDAVWSYIYDNQARQDNLYKYFLKAYTSPEILIFRRNPSVPLQ